MTLLKGLLKNQTIIIDDHKRGCQEKKEWDNNSDVHIDKTTNFRIEGKRQNIKIRIPINSPQRPIQIVNKRNDNIKLPKSIEKENELPRRKQRGILKQT